MLNIYYFLDSDALCTYTIMESRYSSRAVDELATGTLLLCAELSPSPICFSLFEVCTEPSLS